MKWNGQRWLGLTFLALIFFALGICMVPAHFGSLWGDRDFTDWCVPVANRLTGQTRLYEEGMHLPMPPLPYVLPRILFPHGGIWLDGSALNYAFQCGMILLLFWAISRELGPGVTFAVALASMPVYLSMPKTMLYDSMAQFFVASSGIAMAAFVRKRDESRRISLPSNFGHWLRLALIALPLALLVLTKQNTALGALTGVCLALLLMPSEASLSKRAANICVLIVLVAILVCVVTIAFSKFVSFSGMIHDVFLTGSQPKGGPLGMIKSLVIYCLQIGFITGSLYLLICIFNACAGTAIPSWKGITATWLKIPKQKIGVAFDGLCASNLFVPALAGFGAGLALAIVYAKTGVSLKGTMMENAWGTLVLNVGLCLVLVLIATALFQSRQRDDDNEQHPLAAYAIVFLCSALFHNLSVKRLRWAVDNNPLVFLTLALVFTACMTAIKAREISQPSQKRSWLPGIMTFFIIFIIWPVAHFLTVNVADSTQSWPEIHHLAGARLRPESEGMRDLVKTVRSYADPAQRQTVLLLPNDPNVEAWFERDRPKFSCAIIFTDQYWDQYVDRDFAELRKHPPAVIVIGPRNYWRFFCRGWHVNGAAERLIDLVREQMLPKDYELKSQQPIAYQGGTDFMDVYVRKAQ